MTLPTYRTSQSTKIKGALARAMNNILDDASARLKIEKNEFTLRFAQSAVLVCAELAITREIEEEVRTMPPACRNLEHRDYL